MTESESNDERRSLPAVSRLLELPSVHHLSGLYGSDAVTSEVREVLAQARRALSSAPAESPEELSLEALAARVVDRVEARLGHRLTRILNATGVFLHTNLGRAPLPPAIAAGLPGLLNAYCDLEMERVSGRRGDRNRRSARLLSSLTGCEGALVTNNNAAALVLALSTLASGREVVVSRGELVEIGGSFRIAEILAASGARLVEVGSTNRTRVEDYRAAIGEKTSLLLKVHPSNYRISGFTESVPTRELVELATTAEVPVLVDEGSGLLRPSQAPQLADHESLSELLASGCDLVCGSGDKLLGGPQAGLLLGRGELIEACHRNPLYRAFRPDRACFATLEAVLRMHLSGDPLPIERLWQEPDGYRERLERVATSCGGEVVEAAAFVGGGAAPEASIAGLAVAIPGEQELLARLRAGEPPVIGYVRHDRVMLDLRTVDPTDDDALLDAVKRALPERDEG